MDKQKEISREYIDLETGEENIVDVIVEHANLGRGNDMAPKPGQPTG
jgi:hypothetical protein